MSEQAKNPEWWEKNGLVDGKIPKDTSCPFEAECKQIRAICPTKEFPHSKPYDCGIARMRSLVKLYPKGYPNKE